MRFLHGALVGFVPLDSCPPIQPAAELLTHAVPNSQTSRRQILVAKNIIVACLPAGKHAPMSWAALVPSFSPWKRHRQNSRDNSPVHGTSDPMHDTLQNKRFLRLLAGYKTQDAPLALFYDYI